MIELETQEKQDIHQNEPNNIIRIRKRILLLFFVTLIISTISYFSLDKHWLEYIFAHLGGLSIIGLLGCFAGALSEKKGYGYWKAFFLALFLPIFLGTIAVFPFRPISCGGSVSIIVAIIIVTIYHFIKRSDEVKTINA